VIFSGGGRPAFLPIGTSFNSFIISNLPTASAWILGLGLPFLNLLLPGVFLRGANLNVFLVRAVEADAPVMPDLPSEALAVVALDFLEVPEEFLVLADLFVEASFGKSDRHVVGYCHENMLFRRRMMVCYLFERRQTRLGWR
jgi:hypothetical protein